MNYFNSILFVLLCSTFTKPVSLTREKESININDQSDEISGEAVNIVPQPDHHNVTTTTAAPNSTTTKPTTTSVPTSTSTTTKPTTTTSVPTSSKPTSTEKTTTTKSTTISPSSTTTTTTAAPVISSTTKPDPNHNRRFDGPSFIGGIVLALGLVAIGFVAFKFYKARIEVNYHTL